MIFWLQNKKSIASLLAWWQNQEFECYNANCFADLMSEKIGSNCFFGEFFIVRLCSQWQLFYVANAPSVSFHGFAWFHMRMQLLWLEWLPTLPANWCIFLFISLCFIQCFFILSFKLWKLKIWVAIAHIADLVWMNF